MTRDEKRADADARADAVFDDEFRDGEFVCLDHDDEPDVSLDDFVGDDDESVVKGEIDKGLHPDDWTSRHWDVFYAQYGTEDDDEDPDAADEGWAGC